MTLSIGYLLCMHQKRRGLPSKMDANGACGACAQNKVNQKQHHSQPWVDIVGHVKQDCGSLWWATTVAFLKMWRVTVSVMNVSCLVLFQLCWKMTKLWPSIAENFGRFVALTWWISSPQRSCSLWRSASSTAWHVVIRPPWNGLGRSTPALQGAKDKNIKKNINIWKKIYRNDQTQHKEGKKVFFKEVKMKID